MGNPFFTFSQVDSPTIPQNGEFVIFFLYSKCKSFKPFSMTSPKPQKISRPKRDSSITINLASEEKDRLRKEAYENYEGMGSLARKIILRHLDRNGSKR